MSLFFFSSSSASPVSSSTTPLLLLLLLILCLSVISHQVVSLSSHDDDKVNRLETYRVEPGSLSVSGLSSGAFMTVQFQYSHSSRVKGVGVIAGGPFYSALGNAVTAQTVVKHPAMISTTGLQTFAMECAAVGQIDPLHHLKNHKVYVYSGKKDSVVDQGVAKKLETMYEMAGVKQLTTVFDKESEHGMPTLSHGIPCDKHYSPFILKCGYSASGELLRNIYGDSIRAPDSEDNYVKDNLIQVNQKEFLTAVIGHFIGLADRAYVYVPTNCRNKKQECKLHLHFHGCKQSYEVIGDEYVKNNGMNAWAEKNNIIVLYPQTKPSNVPLNPYACFDWFGLTGPLYYSKLGPQIKVFSQMISRIAGNSFEESDFFLQKD